MSFDHSAPRPRPKPPPKAQPSLGPSRRRPGLLQRRVSIEATHGIKVPTPCPDRLFPEPNQNPRASSTNRNENKMRTSETRINQGPIAIIGAGIAGLSAAARLREQGREVVVFEKARGTGGRASTRRSDWGGFNHGAPNFTCSTPEFSHKLKDWCRRGIAEPLRDPIFTLSHGEKTLSKEEPLHYRGIPGMSALVRDLASRVKIHFSTRVHQIHGSPGDWRLTLEGGEDVSGFGAVVVATPAPQVTALLTISRHLSSLVSKIEMEPVHSLMLYFDSPLDLGFAMARIKDSPLAWMNRMPTEGTPSGESWVLQSNPEWSAENMDTHLEEVSQLLLGALGQATRRKLPMPSSWDTHPWRFARATQPLGQPFLWLPQSQ